MRNIDSTLQFAKEYPAAYAALPEAYQADDVLTFCVKDEYITAGPKEDQKDSLGYWTVVFYTAAGIANIHWFDLTTGHPISGS